MEKTEKFRMRMYSKNTTTNILILILSLPRTFI